MKESLHSITYLELSYALVPLCAVIGIYLRWSLSVTTIVYAITRMLLQLALISFFLTFIFNNTNVYFILLVLSIMLFASSWISGRSVKEERSKHFLKAMFSISICTFPILLLIIFVIIRPTPWYEPTYILPMAGMLLITPMNAISLATERFFKEINKGVNYYMARKLAYQASLIPITNMLFAVGLVSIPGMMSGQILAGVDPQVAVRYQILIMITVFTSGGLSSAIYLRLLKN